MVIPSDRLMTARRSPQARTNRGGPPGRPTTGNTALADRFADGHVEHARNLLSAGDELAVMAALLEQHLRMRLLEVAGADLRRGNVRRDGKNGHARSMVIEKAVDQMEVARFAAAGAHRKFTGQMRLGARREGGHFLVPNVDPLDRALSTNSIGQAVEAVSDDSIGPLDARDRECLRELPGDGLGDGNDSRQRRRDPPLETIAAQSWRPFAGIAIRPSNNAVTSTYIADHAHAPAACAARQPSSGISSSSEQRMVRHLPMITPENPDDETSASALTEALGFSAPLQRARRGGRGL
jgi:hypothetical protein